MTQWARGTSSSSTHPASGLAKGVAEALVRRRPRRMVYVSCDAATFARDLKILRAGGFALADFGSLTSFR